MLKDFLRNVAARETIAAAISTKQTNTADVFYLLLLLLTFWNKIIVSIIQFEHFIHIFKKYDGIHQQLHETERFSVLARNKKKRGQSIDIKT